MKKRLALVTAAAFAAGGTTAQLYNGDGEPVVVESAIADDGSTLYSMRLKENGDAGVIVEATNRFRVESLGIEFTGSDSHYLHEDKDLETMVRPLVQAGEAELAEHCTSIDAGPCVAREMYVQRGEDGGSFVVNVQDYPHQVTYSPEGARATALNGLAHIVYQKMCARDGGFCP